MKMELAIDSLQQLRESVRPTADESAAFQFRCRLGFGLFLLLNAILFIRPAEIFPALLGMPIYECVILATIAASLPVLIKQLTPASLLSRPGTLYVLALLPAIVLSHLSHGNFYDARVGATQFLKIAFYFLLLVGLVNTQCRLRIFLIAITGLLLAIAALSLLQYHNAIALPGLAALEQTIGSEELGEVQTTVRLQASGIFNDPNDLSLMLVTALLVQAHVLLSQGKMLRRLACCVSILLLGYAFALTGSRGGFFALIAGAAAYLLSRWGWRRAVPVGLLAFPILLFIFEGRQTAIDLSDSDDTAQGRVLLWREGLALFKSAPLFGVGQGQMADEIGYVAHNSYVHCFAELGFFGGTMFLGAAYVQLASIWRLGQMNAPAPAAELARWRPCFLAILVAYLTGICSLSRSYVLPTYLTFGLAAAYCGLMSDATSSFIPRLNAKHLLKLCTISIVALVGFDVFVRFVAR
jgi:O-antigen ligase